jgi:hypothetical protein
MAAIIARAELSESRGADGSQWHRACATLDALVSYLDAICEEWATTPEPDRLAAARLAADTAARIQSWVSEMPEGAQL